MLTDLKGRIAIVTGAANGIGIGLAEALAQADCSPRQSGQSPRAGRMTADPLLATDALNLSRAPTIAGSPV